MGPDFYTRKSPVKPETQYARRGEIVRQRWQGIFAGMDSLGDCQRFLQGGGVGG